MQVLNGLDVGIRPHHHLTGLGVQRRHGAKAAAFLLVGKDAGLVIGILHKVCLCNGQLQVFAGQQTQVRCGTGGSLQLHLPVVRLIFQCCEPLTELSVDAALASHAEAQPFNGLHRRASAQQCCCQQSSGQHRREPFLFQDHHSSSCRRSAAELLS